MRSTRSAARRGRWGAALIVAALLAGCSAATTIDDDTSTSATESTATGQPAGADPAVNPVTLAIEPMVPSDTAATADGIASVLKKPLANKDIADLAGLVIDPLTGEVLWQRKATSARVPASSMKVLTGAALLASADPNDRLVTKVVIGDEPGQIVFVGGGDVTLTARPVGTPTILPGGPSVADLAAQIQASGFEVTSIGLDTSYWTGPEMADGWDPDEIRGTPAEARGYITPMQALMVDADREDPANEDSPRTGTPALTAGKALAHALGNDDLPVVEDVTAPPGAQVLAQVESQPLSTLLAQALENSDNVLSEALARQAAIARGAAPSFAGVSAAFLQALEDLGLDTAGIVVKDGSGMSGDDRVSPEVLGKLMALAVSGERPEQRLLLTGLPLAGVSGTLAPPRFSQPSNEVGAGWVRAKTGSLAATYALVGYVPDVDGRILVFSFNSSNVISNPGNPDVGTRPAQDALAAALRTCGCSG